MSNQDSRSWIKIHCVNNPNRSFLKKDTKITKIQCKINVREILGHVIDIHGKEVFCDEIVLSFSKEGKIITDGGMYILQ